MTLQRVRGSSGLRFPQKHLLNPEVTENKINKHREKKLGFFYPVIVEVFGRRLVILGSVWASPALSSNVAFMCI